MNSFLKYLVFTIVSAIFLVVQPAVSTAQNPKFSFAAEVSADSILIGDQLELTIKANLPKGYEVQFPFFADTLVTGIEVIGKPTIDTLKKENEGREYLYSLTITSFDEGFYRIPPIRLPFSSGLRIDTAQTSAIWLLVNTLPPDSTITTIYDIKTPLKEPYTFAEIAPWVGGGLLAIALIVFLVYYFIQRRKGKPVFFTPKPSEPAHVIALRELELIKTKKLWDTENHKQYQSKLTDVIRFYIEGRFGVPAMEQTTYEICSSLKTSDVLSKELLDELQELLSLADLVKFAKLKPSVSENLGSLEFAIKLVNSTKPIEQDSNNEADDEDEPEAQNTPEPQKFVEDKGKTI
ncbi:MAG: hypothetical protein PHI03_02945 [Bacteroidales bacterium]|nr:hypothetical protein [Bacteroidales bacterium]